MGKRQAPQVTGINPSESLALGLPVTGEGSTPRMALMAFGGASLKAWLWSQAAGFKARRATLP